MQAATPDPGQQRGRAPYLAVALCLVMVAGVGTVALSTASRGSTGTSEATASVAPPPPSVAVLGASAQGMVGWDTKLHVSASHGTLMHVSGTGGFGVVGAVGANGLWASRGGLVPATAYSLIATVRDARGATFRLPLNIHTTEASKTLQAALSPGDDRTVGVGQPVIVRLNRGVEGAAARKKVESHLSVRTRPAQPGAWRWMSDDELHYRGPQYWQPGTTISVVADLEDLRLPDRVWGQGKVTSTFSVGKGLTTIVDVKNHTMTVSRNGQILRTMEASMGRPGFETRGGNFLVLLKHETYVMDGSTLAVPQDYSTKVEHAIRISNSGTFIHAAPWSVAAQGERNVSHGCINLSPADAAWYFDIVKRGDIVQVVNAEVGPLSWDAGSRDWNMTWKAWRDGTDLA